MLKTYLYVPEELDEEIVALAKNKNLSKAELIRTALKEGVDAIKAKEASSAEALTKVRKLARRHQAKGPADLSVNLDKYLWGI